MTRFRYFYPMRNIPETIRDLVPAHIQYWQARNLPDYRGGPFADRTGGLITLAADRLQDAQHIVQADRLSGNS